VLLIGWVWHWLSIGCALATRRNICVLRTWLRHVIAMSHSRLVYPLPLSRTAIAESHIFRMPCRHYFSIVIAEPQFACCACCVDLSYTPTIQPQLRLLRLWRRLICCRSPDGRTRVNAIYAGACTRVKYGGLFEPLKSHHSATFVNNFVFALYFVWLCCVASYIYIYCQVTITTISSYTVLGNLGN
jgi:hypothetical protein